MKTTLFNISEIRPHLYLCGFSAVIQQRLTELGITHAVDASNMPRNPEYNGIKYMYVRIDDSERADILQHIENVIEFIEEAKRTGGKTLVYCAAGISRSASLCIMYLMKSEKISLKQAYHEVNKKRPIISPNTGFWMQMIDYEFKELGSKSVTLIRDRGLKIPDIYLSRTRDASGS